MPTPNPTPAPWLAWRGFDPCSLVTASEARDLLGSAVTITGSGLHADTRELECDYTIADATQSPPSGLRIALESVQPWEGSRLPDLGPARTGTFEALAGVGDATVVNTEAGMAVVQQCRYLLWIILDPSGPLDPPTALAALTRRAVSRLPSCPPATGSDATASGRLSPLWSAFDPCLLTAAEVEVAVGTPIESGHQNGDCMFVGDTPQGMMPVTLHVTGVAAWTEDPLASPSLHSVVAQNGLAVASEDIGNYWVQQARCLLYLNGSIEPGFLTEPELLALAVTAADRLALLPGCH